VTADPLELRPGAGVENELSAQLGAVFVFRLRSRQLACFSALVRAMSDLSDYAAMVISHDRLIGGKQGRRRAPRYVLQLSAIVTRFSECAKQIEITLADPARGRLRESPASPRGALGRPQMLPANAEHTRTNDRRA
jgi:hypothetical protein